MILSLVERLRKALRIWMVPTPTHESLPSLVRFTFSIEKKYLVHRVKFVELFQEPCHFLGKWSFLFLLAVFPLILGLVSLSFWFLVCSYWNFMMLWLLVFVAAIMVEWIRVIPFHPVFWFIERIFDLVISVWILCRILFSISFKHGHDGGSVNVMISQTGDRVLP